MGTKGGASLILHTLTSDAGVAHGYCLLYAGYCKYSCIRKNWDSHQKLMLDKGTIK